VGQRQRAVADVVAAIEDVGQRRGVEIRLQKIHDAPAAPCAPWLMDRIERAIEREGLPSCRLPSGAGHDDGMAMIDIADIGMIFVRCAGGISHNPAEAITVADAEAGARVLKRFILEFETGSGKRQ
jgi:allantoate deiminase